MSSTETLSSPSGKPAKAKKAWLGRDGLPGAISLDREEYAIFEHVIRMGRIQTAFGYSYNEAKELLESGSFDLMVDREAVANMVRVARREGRGLTETDIRNGLRAQDKTITAEYDAAVTAERAKYSPKLPRGKTVEERDQILREAMKTVFAENPRGMVEAVAGGALNKPKQTITQLTHQFSAGHGDCREEIVGHVVALLSDRYALERENQKVSSRVDEAGNQIARVKIDEVRGRAEHTNMITAWKPAEGGAVEYLRDKIYTTCRPLITSHLVSQLDTVSLDAKMDAGFEPAMVNGESRFVRTTVHTDFEGGEPVDEEVSESRHVDELQADEEQRAKISRARRELHASKDIEADEEIERLEVAPSLADEERVPEEEIAETEHPKAPKASKFEPRDPHRSDAEFIIELLEANRMSAEELKAAASPEARYALMKSSVTALVERATTMEDHSLVLDAVQSWDPRERSLDTYLPEIRQHAELHESKFEPPKAKTVLKTIMQLDLFGAPDENATPEEHIAHSERLIDTGRLWRMRSTPEMLRSSSRPDVAFLQYATGSEDSPLSAVPAERDAAMRTLAKACISSSISKLAVGALDSIEKELTAAIDEWNPSEKFFSEAVSARIMEMTLEGKLSRESSEASVLYARDQTIDVEARREDVDAKTWARRAKLIHGAKEELSLLPETLEEQQARAAENIGPGSPENNHPQVG